MKRLSLRLHKKFYLGVLCFGAPKFHTQDRLMIIPERKLYGRNKGHKLSVRQAELSETLLPKLRVDLSNPAPKDISTLFEVPVSRVHFEIGFGGGEHLAWQAGRKPETGFIGCEPFVNGVAKLLMQVEDDELNNVRVFDDDARFILDWLPEESIDHMYILFPDPWHKKRHHKRRFVSTENLDKLARVMKKNAQIYLATDIGDYMRSSLIAFTRHSQFLWVDGCVADWRQRPENRPVTRYEQKAFDAGRKPAYLTFQRI